MFSGRTSGRSMLVLNAAIFIMSAGFYVMMPLLGNELIGAKRIPVAVVTLILNTRIIMQDLLMLPAGLLADRIGSRNALILAAVIRGTGFLIIGVTSSIPLLFAAGILAGIGGSFFFPASLSLYTELTDESNRIKIFSLREMLNSLGIVLGPLAGTALLFLGFEWVGAGSALLFYISAAALYLFIGGKEKRKTPPGTDSYVLAEKEKNSAAHDWRMVLKDHRFLRFSVILMVVTVYLNQPFIAVPLRVNQIAPGYAYVGIIFSVSSVAMVLLQIRMTAYASARFSQYRIIGLAAAFFAGGLCVMGFVDGIWVLYAGSLVYSIGAILFYPSRNMLIAKYAPKGASGTYFGFQGLINTFGNLIAGAGLGLLYEQSSLPAFRYLPWTVLLAGGIAVVLIIFASEKALGPRQ